MLMLERCAVIVANSQDNELTTTIVLAGNRRPISHTDKGISDQSSRFERHSKVGSSTRIQWRKLPSAGREELERHNIRLWINTLGVSHVLISTTAAPPKIRKPSGVCLPMQASARYRPIRLPSSRTGWGVHAPLERRYECNT